MTGDPFDLHKFTLPSGEAIITPKRVRKRRDQFVMIPLTKVDAIARVRGDKTWVVLCHLLHESWRQHGGAVNVPNGFLSMVGVGRGAKSRALRKLERLGIVSVERRARKSPLVKVNTGPFP